MIYITNVKHNREFWTSMYDQELIYFIVAHDMVISTGKGISNS